MDKYTKRLLISTALALELITISGCGKTDVNSIKDYDTVEIADIYDVDYGKSKLYKDKNNYDIYEVKDNEIINTYASSNDLDTSEIMRLNLDLDGTDITKNEVYVDNTWETTIDSASQYIVYLEDSGYTVLREVDTQYFIDIIISNDVETFRVLIGPNTTTIKSIELNKINIKNYFK